MRALWAEATPQTGHPTRMGHYAVPGEKFLAFKWTTDSGAGSGQVAGKQNQRHSNQRNAQQDRQCVFHKAPPSDSDFRVFDDVSIAAIIGYDSDKSILQAIFIIV
jgi:hypothetical protein